MPEQRRPSSGDVVSVPSRHEDGHWTNGRVTAARNGRLVIASRGHAKASLIAVPMYGHGRDWCWPHEVGQLRKSTR